MGFALRKDDTMNSPKATRLNLLYERLKSTNGVRLGELAKELGVSTKTLQRDFKELQKLGAYKVGQLVFLDTKRAKDELKSDERIVLGILSNFAQNNGTDFYLKAKPLLTKLTQQLEQPIHIATQSESLDSDDLVHFDFIEKLILERVELGFSYRGKDFEVKPFKLAHFDGFWYVLCLDSKDNDIFKKFYFKDMKNLQSLKREFVFDEKLTQKLKKVYSVWFSLDSPFLVQLAIDKKMAKYFKRRSIGSGNLYEEPDGSVVLEIEISHIMEIKPLIYKFIPYIRVIEPAWLNKIIKDELLDFVESL